MLRITIDLIPQGDESRAIRKGQIDIWNDLTGDAALGNYEAALMTWHTPPKVWKKVKQITGFDRVKRGPYDLLYLVLKAAVGDRNP